MAHTMPTATHDTRVLRALLISVIIVALLIGGVALGVYLWPASDEGAVVRVPPQSANAAERTLTTNLSVAPVPQSANAAERAPGATDPGTTPQSANAAERDLVPVSIP